MDFSQMSNEDTAVQDNSPQSLDPPPTVPGRVLHIDADFLAYQCGYRYEEETLQTAVSNLETRVETLRLMAGAEETYLHVTRGNKGGREEIARVQQYQYSRDSRPEGLVERVAELRQYMSDRPDGVAWFDQEADDGMAQAMWAARDEENLAVLWSLDKDLWMVGGYKLNPDTYEIEKHPWGFGSSEYCPDKKKVIGNGTSFFWHQVLMGDSADTIPGLPEVAKSVVIQEMPPGYLTKANERKAKTKAQKIAKRKAVANALDKVKAKKCGPAMAAELLKDCHTDEQAFFRCMQLYAAHYGAKATIVTWDQQTETYTSGQLMLEQARLLWMRREHGQDVRDWFQEILKDHG